MVNVNIFDNETASFWKGPGVDPKTVDTEVFLLPAAASMEKEGSQSNSGRWVQWRYKAANPPGDALSDGDITMRIMDAVRDLYQKEGGAFPEQILNLKWDYKDGLGTFDVLKVAKQINGHLPKDLVIEDPVARYQGSKSKRARRCRPLPSCMADGSTSSGNWLMSGSFDQKGENKMQKRGKEDPTGLGLFPTGPTPGRSTGASSTTGPPAISKENPTIRRGNSWSGWATSGSAMSPMVPGRRWRTRKRASTPSS